jgi:hypothetical protein
MITTNVNSGGIFAMMNEGQALIMMIVIMVVFTFTLNACMIQVM